MSKKIFIISICINLILLSLIFFDVHNRFKRKEVKVIKPQETTVLNLVKLQYKDLGKFRCTAYCPCKKCSGEYGDLTATGTKAEEGRTIAVDPKVIPYGSRVIINNHEYIAEDCGGMIKNKRVDIYFKHHEDAKEFGVKYLKVKIKNY